MHTTHHARALGLPALAFTLAALAAPALVFAQAADPASAGPKPAIKPAAKPAAPTHPAAHPAGNPPTPVAPKAPAANASAKPAAKGDAKAAVAKKGAKPAPVAAVEAPLPPATPDQINAAEMIYYGLHTCEFKQTMDVSIDPKYPGYVDVKFDKRQWTMKPVLSSTGALRLEDVKNTAVVIQIAQKSMLLNTVSGQRLVDECISAKQREMAEEAKRIAAAAAAAPAASGAK